MIFNEGRTGDHENGEQQRGSGRRRDKVTALLCLSLRWFATSNNWQHPSSSWLSWWRFARTALGSGLMGRSGQKVGTALGVAQVGNEKWKVKTLPKAQRTRGLSSSYQSEFLRSYYEFLHRACSNYIWITQLFSTFSQLSVAIATTSISWYHS